MAAMQNRNNKGSVLGYRISIAAYILLIVCCYASTTLAGTPNSCSNVISDSLMDDQTVELLPDGNIRAIGTFRIEGEADEGKQPMFNINNIWCHKEFDDSGNSDFGCNITSAIVDAESKEPNSQSPNCQISLDPSTYSMKEVRRGVFIGSQAAAGDCYDITLTIDTIAKRVFRSYLRSKYADKMEKIAGSLFPNLCGQRPTHVLMNCTRWAAIRKSAKDKDSSLPSRYCDFSSASDH